MKYAVLLAPHANGRYEEAMREPARAELELILSGIGIDAPVGFERRFRAGILTFEAASLTERQISALSCHSLAYLFGICQPDGSFLPLGGAPEVALYEDLAFIQKYKGKTNERFTQFLINFALFSSRFAFEECLKLLDPMCGRGTTLFQAVNRGWNAAGLDADKKDVQECGAFFEKYLQFHRLKYKKTLRSQTVAGQNPVQVTRFALEGKPSLALASADAAMAGAAYGKEEFHLIVCDLPYGVQHAPSGKGGAESFENTLIRVLPKWREALKPGGAMALSYNVFTLKTARVRSLMAEAGLTPMNGGPYDHTEHWVEQAVTRDLAVGVKE